MGRRGLYSSVAWLLVMASTLSISAVALASPGAANARPATRSEHQAIAGTFEREDGSASEIRAVYVSRSDASLAVVCAKTPEAGTFAYVFARSRGRWRYATSGRPGYAGSGSERKLERACD